ncbi:hypothetical protein MMC28_007069 [Mycoblastus sanguinarius]|nr:hypothetical protein [Mycoblastus sanguinarius]
MRRLAAVTVLFSFDPQFAGRSYKALSISPKIIPTEISTFIPLCKKRHMMHTMSASRWLISLVFGILVITTAALPASLQTPNAALLQTTNASIPSPIPITPLSDSNPLISLHMTYYGRAIPEPEVLTAFSGAFKQVSPGLTRNQYEPITNNNFQHRDGYVEINIAADTGAVMRWLDLYRTLFALRGFMTRDAGAHCQVLDFEIDDANAEALGHGWLQYYQLEGASAVEKRLES